jgi:hypothetical protein
LEEFKKFEEFKEFKDRRPAERYQTLSLIETSPGVLYSELPTVEGTCISRSDFCRDNTP